MDPIAFIHQLTYDDLPQPVVQHTKRIILDNLGVTINSVQSTATSVIYNFVADCHPGSMPLIMDGRQVSPLGASLAHGIACDAVDAHDSFKEGKGHPGAAIIPAALSLPFMTSLSGRDFLVAIVVAYEICMRAAVTLHATATEYHTSGAWNAIGVAAMFARVRKLSPERTRHALGIAEYYGPRSPMMRCINYPSMVKDGSGWGAYVGLNAGLMAEYGFTGAPAVLVENEFDESILSNATANKYWASLGKEFKLEEIVFKTHALCGWTQAAVHGLDILRREENIDVSQIVGIEVETFSEGVHMLRHPEPPEADTAQYSMPFGIGATLVHGAVTIRELEGKMLKHPEVLRLAHLVTARVNDDFSKLRPYITKSRVTLQMNDGTSFVTIPTAPHGFSKEDYKGNEALQDKFRTFAGQVLEGEMIDECFDTIWRIDEVTEEELLGFLKKLGKKSSC